jgi:hypothetical protein
MSDLREAARQALDYINEVDYGPYDDRSVKEALHAALEQTQRTLTDEVIADLWHANGGFHHHFARAVERYLKGEK